MAGGRCPETPRQKMIGMMYLFLTALLALNVSGEVLQAFLKIDESLAKTTEILLQKNDVTYKEIANKAAESAEYVGLNNKAGVIEQKTIKLLSDINRLKLMIISYSQGEEVKELDIHSIKKIDDLNAASIIMIGEGGPKMGDSIRLWMNNYQEFMLSMIKDEDKGSYLYESIKESLGTPDDFDNPEDPKNWQTSLCRGMPLIGTIALLSKLQADIKNTEADILNYMILDLEGGVDIRITSLEGIVSAPKGFIIRGGQYTANIFLGARDSTMDPLVYVRDRAPYWKTEITPQGDTLYALIDGDPMQNYDTIQTKDGYARYVRSATSVGDNEFGGLIMYQTRRGKEYYPFTGNYTVGDAGFTVSATNCAVFYRGLDNPVDVAVSGYPKESVNVSISGGASIRRAGNAYMVSVPQSVSANEVNVTVSVRTDEGGRTLGSQKFRILNVPPPTILLGGAYKDGATVPRAAITQNPFLSARLESDFFPFEGVSYTVTKYDFLYSVRGVTDRITVNGNRFSAEVTNQINRMGAGQQLSFSNIFVQGPSGTRQTQGINVILR